MTRRSVFGRIVAGALGVLGLGKAQAAPVDEWEATRWDLTRHGGNANVSREPHCYRWLAWGPAIPTGNYGSFLHDGDLGDTPTLPEAKAAAEAALARMEREAPDA